MWINFKKLGRSGQQYIVPTIDALKLLALNLVLLLVGLVYANNYVLLFNFILFCLFLGSMYYTHFNLHGLKITSAKFSPTHLNDVGILSLHFKSKSNLGHYFLSIGLNNHLIELFDSKHTFSFSAEAKDSLHVEIPVKALMRGEAELGRISIQTLFPFHLFRSFIYFDPFLKITIYPQLKDLEIHQTNILVEDIQNDGDDFFLEDFKIGDPLKRVHWKKLAQTNRWYSKKVMAPNAAPVMLSPNENTTVINDNFEDQLSSICAALCGLHNEKTKYGLTLGSLIILPDNSNHHLNLCLHALAVYED